MPQAFSPDEVSAGGSRLPAGTYTATLLVPEPKVSKKGLPMIEARYLIQGGEQAGNEARAWYSLTYYLSKNGKPISRGYGEMSALFTAIGKPLNPNDPKDRVDLVRGGEDPEIIGETDALKVATKAARLFKARVGNTPLQIVVTEEKDKDDPDKTNTRVRVIGPAESTTKPAAKSVAVDEDDDES